MTVTVLTSTVEVARARAERIRAGIRSYLETVEEIALAWERRDWAVLGYADWAAYVTGEFTADMLRVPEVHRARAVEALRLANMSNRAIGAALGLSEATVRRDLAPAVAAGRVPSTTRGADGKTYATTRPTPAAQVAVAGVGPAPDEQVWIAATRKGIPGHGLHSPAWTRCNRATANGETLSAGDARERYAPTWCRTCWPDETARGAAADPGGADGHASAPAADPDPLAGVGSEYHSDPARRIAAVAEVAPAYVRPVETAAGGSGAPADGPDARGGATGPAPAPPPPGGGAGVTPTTGPAGLGPATITRVRAALYHLRAVGGRRTAPHQYELPHTSTAQALHRGGTNPVDVVDVQWWPPTDLSIRWLAGGGRYEPVGGTDIYPASVDQALDVLCALGILPAHLSALYAAGVQAGLRAGDAIDGNLKENQSA
ncbi:hypothetical protein [Micromonospora fluostatini]|uniref:hypothetical protein n=1 Tax=Micromonospora sp. JCM 30529 TaxID=3421643 RepID=UPI003D166585